MKTTALILTAASLLLLGCSKKTLSIKQASELIGKTLDPKPVSLNLVTSPMAEQCSLWTDMRYAAARKAGVMRRDSRGLWVVPLIIDSNGELAPAAEDLSHGLEAETKDHEPSGCEGQMLDFEVARRTIAEVTTMHQVSSTTAEAEFTWKWVLTPAGEKFMSHLSANELNNLLPYLQSHVVTAPNFNWGEVAVLHSGKRTLQKRGEAWQVMLDREVSVELVTRHLALLNERIDFQIGSHCPILTAFDPSWSNLKADILAKAQYVSLTGNSQGYSQARITDLGRATMSDLQPQSEGCEFEASFLLARPGLVEITGINGDQESPEITYSWRWVLTRLGAAMGEHGQIYAVLTDAQRKDLNEHFSKPASSKSDEDELRAFSIPLDSRPVVARHRVKKDQSDGGWTW